ncbi:MAG: DUF4037 domain-containing protein [Clostridia bacterium]|nr:DUF4037 domain-containing protein [Clostridia bacterium]
MKGLELAKQFYLEYGAPMLHKDFPHLEHLVAVGLVGSGSECFGFDDAISADHDFEPAFCLFLPDEDLIDRREAFALERAYAKLPREFMGYQRNALSPVGGNRHGVIRIDEFFQEKIGTPDGTLSLRDWFYLPEQSLAEATNGCVFRDDLGYFSAIRDRLAYYPNDVRLKKLAGDLLMMGQAGQYNYPRCIKRGDTAAAQLSVYEFVKNTMSVLFLLSRRYMPYYKWSFRALSDLPLFADMGDSLEHLISTPNTVPYASAKQELIEQISAAVIAEIRRQQLSDYPSDELEGHAYAVNNGIADGEIRNLHILFAI